VSSQPTSQQRIGAQKAAAAKVRAKEGEFQQDLRKLLGQADGLRPHYKGPAADAFFTLVGNWLEDANAIVVDMENFAEKLDRQESTVNAAQDQAASSFSKAATRLSTTVK
jgi:uncharacterized protein YukE